MYPLSMMFSGPVGTLVAVLLLAASIIWICVPFAVFAIKNQMNEVVRHAEEANRKLEILEAVIRDPSAPPPPPPVKKEIVYDC